MIGKILADSWGWTKKWSRQTNDIRSITHTKSLKKIITKAKDDRKINGTYTLCSDRNEIILTPQQWHMYKKLLRE